MKFKIKSLYFLLLVVMALGLSNAPALAYTLGGSQIENAKSTDTFPLNPGQMSVRWVNKEGADTQYSDTPTSLTTEVDTGYDIVNIVNAKTSDSWTISVAGAVASQASTAGETEPKNVTAGDTVVHAYQVHNRSNNAAPIPFRLSHYFNDGVTTSNDTFVVELFYVDATQTADQFDTTTANRISGNDTAELNFIYNEVKTVYAVITVKSNASNQDSVTSRFLASDQVDPSRGDTATAGDQWEEGTSLANGTADNNDTQVMWMTTTVSGPVLDISKSLASLAPQGTYRPGDTVEFTITVTNTGADTAYTVVLSDAVPDSTTYAPGSAAGGNTLTGNTLTETRYYTSASDDETAASTGADDTNTRKVAWEIAEIGPTGAGNDSVAITFQVLID